MDRWVRHDRTIGIIDDSDTQSNGMLLPICYLETYDHPEEMVDYYSTLIINSELMMDLLRDIYYNHNLPNGVDEKIEKVLGGLL